MKTKKNTQILRLIELAEYFTANYMRTMINIYLKWLKTDWMQGVFTKYSSTIYGNYDKLIFEMIKNRIIRELMKAGNAMMLNIKV